MLNSYKKISIIYGGSGKEYATQIKDRLDKLHLEEHYPIDTCILCSDWVGHDILGMVVSAIKNSDLIYIVFTLDDIGCRKDDYNEKGADALNGRLRQNVLIELGMALVVLGEHKENLRVVANFDKNDLGTDFPSDIRDALNINSFVEGGFDIILQQVENHIKDQGKEGFGVLPTTNILHDVHAIEDFENVFEEFNKVNLFSDQKIKSLNDILSLWLPAVKQFTFPEERLLYCLERTKALPVFGDGAELNKWIKKFKEASIIECGANNPDRKFIRFVHDVAKACLDYTIIKTDGYTEDDYEQYSELANTFEILEEEYHKFVNQGVSMRPIVRFMLAEYYGLTLMRLIKLHKDYQYVDKAIEVFDECYELCDSLDTAFHLYKGYTTFNLGRAYHHRFVYQGKEEDEKKFLRYMKETVSIRHDWKDRDGFIQCYSNALSYEYFYASSEFLFMKKEVNEISDEDYKNGLARIIKEIDEYICKDSELLKLYKVKQKCVKLNK